MGYTFRRTSGNSWDTHSPSYGKNTERKVLFDGITWEITLREVMFSILILGMFAFLGFLVHSAIDKKVDDSTLKYRQAVSIQDEGEFRHAMDTDVGNAFVRGKVEAVTPVKTKLVKGEYLRIHVDHQKYRMHTRVVTYTTYDSKGRPHVHHRTVTYWSWDTVNSFTTNSQEVVFCGSKFKYDKFEYSCANTDETIVGGGTFNNERDVVYTTKDGFTGTIFADLRNGSVTGRPTMVGRGIEKYRESLEKCTWPYVLFWILWIVLTVVAIVLFYIIDNRWLEG